MSNEKTCEQNCQSFAEYGDEACSYCRDSQLENENFETCDRCDCVMINGKCAEACQED